MHHWHIITGEYPPQLGGVSDYTRLVAHGLAKSGDEVEVWAPDCGQPSLPDCEVGVHRLPGHFGPRALAALDRATAGANGSRILVQYVPHAFGFKAMNLPFCWWLFARRRRNITVMFHEVLYRRNPGQPLRHNLLAFATRNMAKLAASAAARIFVSSASWETLLRPMVAQGQSIRSLPVPSNVPVSDDTEAILAVRARYAPAGGLIAGHFGTHGARIHEHLEASLPEMLRNPRVCFILIGRGGLEFRDLLARRHPDAAHRLHATGPLPGEQLSTHISACDLMIQPYPDGISTRRTSAMAAMSHGRPIVTTQGFLTEPLWAESGAVALAPEGDSRAFGHAIARLLDDQALRQRLGRRAAELYLERFDLRHTISTLRNCLCGSR